MVLLISSCIIIFASMIIIGIAIGLMWPESMRTPKKHHFPSWYMPQGDVVNAEKEDGISLGKASDLENDQEENAAGEFVSPKH